MIRVVGRTGHGNDPADHLQAAEPECLKAPTLDKNTEGKVDEKTNELTYTFNWTQENIGTETPTYSIKLYGLLTDANGNVTGQEQIALKDGVNLANEVQRSGSNSFTLPVNVDTMLANGSDSWRYDKVRLEVTRVAAAGTDEIGDVRCGGLQR